MRWFQSPENPTIRWKTRDEIYVLQYPWRDSWLNAVAASLEKLFSEECMLRRRQRGEDLSKQKCECRHFSLEAHEIGCLGLTWYFAKEKLLSWCTSNNVEWIEVRPTCQICLASTETFLLSLSGDCISDPSKCFHGLTVAFWMKFFSGRFIISSGGHSSFATGFDFYRESPDGKFILMLETSTHQWSLQLNNIPEVAKGVFLSSP